MRHHESCNSWPSFHPYDCPECKILENLGAVYTDKDLDDAFEQGYDEHKWQHEYELNDAYDEGFEAGKETVLNCPEDFGLVEANG